MTKHYVDNKEFHAALVQYHKDYQDAIDNDKPTPEIPIYIWNCFHQIAKGLTRHYRFNRYPDYIKEDMIQDAFILQCEKIHNFDVKLSNPFAYFTQVCWFHFIHFVEQERDEVKAKFELCLDMGAQYFSEEEFGDDGIPQQLQEFLNTHFEHDELDKLHEESKGKFVHRMITKPVKKKKEDELPSDLVSLLFGEQDVNRTEEIE